jgi:hypothetical protein
VNELKEIREFSGYFEGATATERSAVSRCLYPLPIERFMDHVRDSANAQSLDVGLH